VLSRQLRQSRLRSGAVSPGKLAAFARQAGASPRKKLVLFVDRSSWHISLHLRVPDHVYVPFLPPYSPELQPERLWPLTNVPWIKCHFASIEDVEEAHAQHCVALQPCPELIRSKTLFHWWR
jgi:hypothetical protein